MFAIFKFLTTLPSEASARGVKAALTVEAVDGDEDVPAAADEGAAVVLSLVAAMGKRPPGPAPSASSQELEVLPHSSKRVKIFGWDLGVSAKKEGPPLPFRLRPYLVNQQKLPKLAKKFQNNKKLSKVPKNRPKWVV
jgi:hypothetical protein